MKDIYEKPMASIIFTVKDGSLRPEIKNKQDKAACFHHCYSKTQWSPSQTKWATKKRHSNADEKGKTIIYIHRWHDLIYRKILKKSIKTAIRANK